MAQWNCKLCAQKNTIDVDRCITCGRTCDWKPSPRPSEDGLSLVPTPPLLCLRDREVELGPWEAMLQPLLAAITFLLACLWPIRFLHMDEQIRVQHLTSVTVTNGPGLHFVNPFKSTVVVKAETLGVLDYARVRDIVDGAERCIHGPCLLFLGPYERIEGRGQGVSLRSDQYVFIDQKQSGQRRVERGPLVWIPGPREEGKVLDGIRLSSTEYVFVQNTLTGERRIDRGPCIWFPGPYDEWDQGTSTWLSSTEYVTVQDTMTGERRVDKGPCVWFPGPYDEWVKGSSISLSCTQYLTVFNKLDGKSKLVKGPCIWFPGPYDNASDVADALVLQDDEYVKLKDISTGTRWVHRGKSLLFLEPTWQIESANSQTKGIQKSLALKGREFLRLQIAPHLKMTKDS